MDIQYFINKFEAIPEKKWCKGSFTNSKGQKCANGHLGVRMEDDILTLTKESIALCKIFKKLQVHRLGATEATLDGGAYGENYSNIAATINNGETVEYQQATPKQRILAALRDLQEMEEQEDAVERVKAILQEPIMKSPKVNILETATIVVTIALIVTYLAIG